MIKNQHLLSPYHRCLIGINPFDPHNLSDEVSAIIILILERSNVRPREVK